MNIKASLGEIKALRAIPMLREYLADFARFVKYSGTFRAYKDRDSFRSLLTLQYHCIEKALALKETRIGFGKPRIARLIADTGKYIRRYGMDETAQVVLNVLSSYATFHTENDCRDEALCRAIDELRASAPTQENGTTEGGAREVTGDEIRNAASIDFRAFAGARFSIRDFERRPVDPDLIREAVSMALKTPSVCNRQPWRVHAYLTPEDAQSALSYQVGNEGFGNDAGAVLVITSPLSAFFGTGERNEPYVDGGMFSMSLVYALHSLGLGACCLNLCTKNGPAREFRQACGIPEDEAGVVMIAVGHIPGRLRVAVSHRKPVDEVLRIH